MTWSVIHLVFFSSKPSQLCEKTFVGFKIVQRNLLDEGIVIELT